MNLYGTALFCHVIVVVYLLGADLGRAYLARSGTVADAAAPARALAARATLWLGSVTNAALILILPAGISVGVALGAFHTSTRWWFAVTMLVALAWLALSIAADRAAAAPGGGRGLARADTIARVVMGAGNILDGALVFAGTSRTVDAWWLGGKLVAYGLLILLGTPARLRGFHLRRELARLEAAPGDAAASARLGEALARLPLALVVPWLVIGVAAWLGATKPF